MKRGLKSFDLKPLIDWAGPMGVESFYVEISPISIMIFPGPISVLLPQQLTPLVVSATKER